MSASENQVPETSKDADDMKADSPWNIIHIRLPLRKRLSDASLILSKKVPRNTTNVGSKEVPEPITDNLGKNLITAPVQGVASSHSPRAGLCNEASSNMMSKLPAEYESDTPGNKLLELDEANVSTLSKNLRVSAEEQGSDASSYAAKQGLCNEANPGMILALPVQELPGDNNISSPSKNHATTGKQGEVERINSPRKKLFCNTDSKIADEEGNSRKWNITITTEEVFEGAKHPIPTKLSDEVNAPSVRPSDPANKSSPHKRLTSSVEATGTSQNTPGMNRSPYVCQAVEQSTNAANMEVIKVYQELEEKVKRNVYDLDKLYHQATEAKTNPSMIIPPPVHELPEDHIDNSPSKKLTTTGKQDKDEHNTSLRKKLLYGTGSKVEAEEGNYPSWKPRITAVKYEKMFEEANHPIPCKKLSDEAKNNGPSNRPTDSANNKSVYKRQRTSSVQATGTSQNIPGMKLSASVSQAVEQSTNSANMDVRKVYQEFEEKIKRTVYLDNFSYQATEANTNPTLSTTAIECEVFEHANHTIHTKKLSDVARNKAPSNRPTDPAKENIPRKKPRTSAVQATVASQNTSTMRLPIPDGLAVKQSRCAADLEAIKQYQEFEEKVKRTVYLDNLSPQATDSVIKAALSQFCTIRKVSFVVNYTIAYNIPQSALVEMETEKDAEVVVSMLHDFPFMMSGMPRPARAIHATAEMFNDRPRRPGSKLKFRWVGHTDPDYKMVRKLKFLSRKHEVENVALIEHELEEEKLLAAKQQENLNVNYEMRETMDSVLMSGMSNYLSSIYNVNWNDVF